MALDRQQAIDAVLAAQHAVMQGFHVGSAWLQLDLTISQLKALGLLAEAPLTVGHLGDRLAIGRVAATHLVDHLVGRQLVSRSEDTLDRRRTVVQLTASGDEVVTLMRQGPVQRARGLLDQLEDDDLEALLRGMRALARIATTDVQSAATRTPEGALGSGPEVPEPESWAAGNSPTDPTP
jgi:DNA-binding MarR family transcriptional regulator